MPKEADHHRVNHVLETPSLPRTWILPDRCLMVMGCPPSSLPQVTLAEAFQIFTRLHSEYPLVLVTKIGQRCALLIGYMLVENAHRCAPPSMISFYDKLGTASIFPA